LILVAVMSFALDRRLAADTLPIGDLALSRALLMNDARYPWLILVPRRVGLSEIVDLTAHDRAVLIEEVAAASAFLRALPRVDKLNVGALGNVVRQLHVHVVGRAIGDPAWPGPVWGAGEARPYESGAAEALIVRARDALIGTAKPAPKTI
jgi:diadenosine tetraphosphate (Ap4A) HIT family hydrolase